MVGLPEGLKFAQGLAGLLSGIVLAVIALVGGAGASLGVGGGGAWSAILLFALLLVVGSPLWYWILRPIFVWSYRERNAPWYRPPGTLHNNRVVRVVSIGGYSLSVLFLLLVFSAAIMGGGGEQLEVGEEAETEKFTASVTEVRTADRFTEGGGFIEENQSAADSATFVLIQFQVENTGDSQGEPPGDGLITEEIELQYKDNSQNPMRLFNFTADGSSYVSYDEAVQEQDGTLFPGASVSGWLVFELPEGFEQGRAVVRVELGPDSDVYEWTLG